MWEATEVGLAPVPSGAPEIGSYAYDRVMAPARPGVRGPLRYEEGLGSDRSVPNDFVRGATEALNGAPGRPNDVDRETQFKHAAETLQERAHPGSASWVEAPTFKREFVADAMGDWSEPSYAEVKRSGGRYERRGPAVIT